MLQAWLWLPELPFSLERAAFPAEPSSRSPLRGQRSANPSGRSRWCGRERQQPPWCCQGGFGADKHELASVTSRLPWEGDGEPAAGPWEPRVWCPCQPRLLSPSGLNWFRALGSSGVSSVFCQESKLPPHLGVAERGPCTTWLCCRLCPEGRGEFLQCLFAVVTQLSSKTHPI